ncbi:hypothetical protein [Subtercola sp. YIM 133946]|uniref:hypothetical protein n=1 Tax=Subtercola sp. YIM 133946 TaxID=3118909 RepID=UPI002F922A61
MSTEPQPQPQPQPPAPAPAQTPPHLPAQPQTFGGRAVADLTDADLRQYTRHRRVSAIVYSLCLIAIATGPVLIATAFARDEVAADYGSSVYVALGSLVLVAVVLLVVDLVVQRRYRSADAYRHHLGDAPTVELSGFGMFVLKEVETVLLRGILPSITAASLFVTVLRLSSKDAAFDQQQLFQYYVFAYFALFGIIAIALGVRRIYLDQETRNKVVA